MNPHTDEPGHAHGCARPDLAGELIRWEELDFQHRLELERHAGECASCGPALVVLRKADAWLKTLGQPTRAHEQGTSACPDPEDLYDFGKGPGARDLAPARRRALEAHLVGCADCRGLIATLASRPPVPLVLGGGEEFESEPRRVRPSAPAQRAALPRWALAAAAVVAIALGAGLLWEVLDRGASAGMRAFPEAPTLRGEDGSALLFPRGHVLADAAGAPWSALRFEIDPQAGASAYRVTVFSHRGGAFERGDEVATLRGPASELDADAELAAKLRPGRYTWEAWATRDGLEVFLDRRDFELDQDPALSAELAAIGSGTEGERAMAMLQILHARGYVGDARALARTLPPSPERDAYLGRKPGR